MEKKTTLADGTSSQKVGEPKGLEKPSKTISDKGASDIAKKDE